MKEASLDYSDICLAAAPIRPEFEEWMAVSPYEPKGILNSEMLFLCSVLQLIRPRRIIESGRARAQSTLMLSLAFPEIPVISIEHDPHSSDVAIASARLAGRPNVDARFGDSCDLLPTLAQRGDIVLIDGPKGFKAIRLAMRLFAQTEVSAVFIHDLYPGMDERDFVGLFFPDARFSDDYRWARSVADLDVSALSYLAPNQRLGARTDGLGYGFSLTYLPRTEGKLYTALDYVAEVSRIVSRIKRRVKR